MDESRELPKWVPLPTHLIQIIILSSSSAASLKPDNDRQVCWKREPSETCRIVALQAQGEDRWLCTLLLKQGWRIEYIAASDAYTNAPEAFKEFYNQRRRWGPSTMANIADLLGDGTVVIKRNPSMSRLYMLYQLFSLASSVVAPSTVVLMIAGTLSILLDIHPNGALVLAVIPPAIFLGVSFKVKSDTQIIIAAVMSCLYAFLMMIGALTIIGNILVDQTIMTPSSLFLVFLIVFYLVAAVMHPQEIGLVVYGLLSIICIPSAYLLLGIYSMVNMNNVSWGTRETAPAAGAAKPAATSVPQTPAMKAKNTVKKFFSNVKCCGRPCRRIDEEIMIHHENPEAEAEEPEDQPRNTIVEEVTQPEAESRPEELIPICPHQCWVSQLQSLSDDMGLVEDSLDSEEEQFFREMTAKYLEPIPEDKEKQKKMADNLRHLRNQISFVFFICNAFWLVMTFFMQLGDVVHILVPKVDMNLQFTGQYMAIDPLGIMFILSFALLVLIQFIAMLYHRIYTLIHFIAFLDTEAKSEKQTQPVQQVEDSADEVSDSDDVMFPSLVRRNHDRGTLV